MDFLNEFSRRVSSVARSVTERSKESGEVQRLNAEMRAAQETLDKLYRRYGMVCYALKLGGGSRQEAEDLALRIRAAQLQAEEIAEQLEAAREMKRCPGCGALHPKEARYCSGCGKRLPEEAPKPEPVAEGEYCPSCGVKREGGEALCPVCGAAFEAQEPAEPVSAQALAPSGGPDIEEPDGSLE